MSAVTETATGHVWVGTQHRGALQLDLETGRWRSFANDPQDPASLSDNEVYCIMMDRTGVIWIGTSNGANRLDSKAKQFHHICNQPGDPSSLSHDCVWSIWETRRGDVWAVTEDGLNIMDPETGEVTQVKADPDDPHKPSYDSFIELFEDALGDPRLVVHSPFGGRVNGPWGLALTAALRERTGVEVEVQTIDDGILLRLLDAEAVFPLDVVSGMGTGEARERILL